MIDERRHAPFWDFIHVAQVGEENAGPRAVQSAALIIRARSGRFLERFHAAHFAFRFWIREEQLLATLRCRVE